MSKYEPLSHRLRSHEADEWRASFSDVEQVLGFPLPKGARTGRTWWANDAEKGHSRSWAGQGWQVGDLDPTAETVVFRRSAASATTIQKVAHLEPLAEGVEVEPPEATAAPLVVSGARPMPTAGEEKERPPARPTLDKNLVAGLVAGGAAIVAGLGALAVRRIIRRR